MSEAKLVVKEKGPILVSGDFTLCDDKGNSIDTQGKATIALCACGLTENGPFCDGKHKQAE